MAHEDDRRWRGQHRRGDDRPYGSGPRQGNPSRRGGEDWGDRSDWGNRDRGEWSTRGPGADPRSRNWGDRERWGERTDQDWEEISWRDFDRDLERDRGRGHAYGREFQRNFPGRDMGQTGKDMNRGDWRQARDYPGSLRSGDYGRGQGRAPYAGSGRAGRSGMGYGGAYGGGYAGSRQRGGRDYDPFEDMSSEPGFGAGSGGGRRMGGEGYGYGGPHEWGGPGHGDERGFWDKATDEVSSWFGDEDAERRREDDRRHSGRGPRNYARSDARINEDVCDRLTDHPGIDASDVEVSVSGREVTLSGVVQSRREKRDAEDVAESVSGVTHVQNNLRVRQAGSSVQATLDSFANAASGAFGERGGTTMSSRSGAGAASADATPSDSPSKTTTGSSPGVMRPDPGPSTAKGG